MSEITNAYCIRLRPGDSFETPAPITDREAFPAVVIERDTPKGKRTHVLTNLDRADVALRMRPTLRSPDLRARKPRKEKGATLRTTQLNTPPGSSPGLAEWKRAQRQES